MVTAALLVIGLYAGICAALAWNTLRPKRGRVTLPPAYASLPVESITFASKDGVRLAGWLVRAGDRPRGIIILCHGVDSNRTVMLGKAAFLRRHGFSCLLFDFRARGESGGSLCTLGYREVDDLLGAIAYVKSRADTRDLRLGVLGESMGGAVALLAAARSPEVKAVVAESPFARLDGAVANHFRAFLGPAGPVFGVPVRLIGERVIGCRCDRIAPVEEIAKIAPQPLLLIQDGADTLCPPDDTRRLMDAAGEPKHLWTVPGAGHVGAFATDPAGYEERVIELFDRG